MKPLWMALVILVVILSGWVAAETLRPSQRAIFANWLDPNGVADFTGDGICNFADFALAAGRKRDFMAKAMIWGKWIPNPVVSGDPNGDIIITVDVNDHTIDRRTMLCNLATYIAESNSITKVDRKQRTIELKAFYAELWLEWNE